MIFVSISLFIFSIISLFLFRTLFKASPNKDVRDSANVMTNMITSISAGLAVGTLAISMITVISAGHRGVMILFGDVQEKVLPEGFHIVNPFVSVVEMSARIEKDEEQQMAETSDTQSVVVSIITNWRPKADALAMLYKDYGLEYYKKIVTPAVRESVKAEVAKHKVTDLISKRPEIHEGVKTAINTWLNKYNLEVLEVGIGDIDFSEKYDAAIEAKQVQEQEALQKKYELEKTKTEAEMSVATAKGEADSRIERANGEAESLKLAARAEAEALSIRAEAQASFNRKVAESLSDLLIQSEYLKRWDGKLPVYTLGNSPTMMMLPGK